MTNPSSRPPLPAPVARAYIERIARCMLPGSPWFYPACEAHHELCHPDTHINEFLAWIDQHPASPFERHLRAQVRG